MAYRMRRPPSHRARPAKPVSANSAAGGALATDPDRQQVVIAAFVETYGRLERLMDHGWTGALGDLERLSPAHAAALDAAEARADELAVAVTKRTAGEAEFQAALRAYEAEWTRAAGLVKSARLGPCRQPCAGCRCTDATITVIQDDGTRRCSSCHRGGAR